MPARKKPVAGQPIVIKKYANRRLYDTGTSAYVTLEDLCQMVKDGQDFVVQDAKTDEDLTRQVLTQIIFEQESKGYNLLPIPFLRRIISFYDDSLSSFVPPYLEQMMDQFSNNQERMRSMIGFSEFSPLRSLEQLRQQNLELFEKSIKSSFSMWNPFAAFTKDKDAQS